MECIYRFLIVAILVVIAISWKAHEVTDFCRKAWPEKKKLCDVVAVLCRGLVVLIAGILILEPMIPGATMAEIHAPATYATSMQNLSVRVTPTGCNRERRVGMTKTGVFDRTGVALVPLDFHVLQNHMTVQLLDASQDPRVVRQRHVAVSVCERLGVSKLEFSF